MKETCKDYIIRCAKNCNCTGELNTASGHVVLSEKLAEKIDEELLSKQDSNVVVSIQYDQTISGYRADKTYDELLTAYNDGKNLTAVCPENDGASCYFSMLTGVCPGKIIFSGIALNENNITVYAWVTIDDQNNVTTHIEPVSL